MNASAVQPLSEPARRDEPRPAVVWITGLSGAGKSTIAREVATMLRALGSHPIVLDGDEIRAAINDPNAGHDRTGRLANAMRICRLARLLADQGFLVIVATMSLFREVHAWNRAHLPDYLEVWVKVGLDVLRQRDARSLYSRAAAGAVRDVVGIHLEYDEPESPHLVLENEESSASASARRLLDVLLERHPTRS